MDPGWHSGEKGWMTVGHVEKGWMVDDSGTVEGRDGWWMSGEKGWMVDDSGTVEGRGGWWMSGEKGWMVDEWREGMDGG